MAGPRSPCVFPDLCFLLDAILPPPKFAGRPICSWIWQVFRGLHSAFAILKLTLASEALVNFLKFWDLLLSSATFHDVDDVIAGWWKTVPVEEGVYRCIPLYPGILFLKKDQMQWQVAFLPTIFTSLREVLVTLGSLVSFPYQVMARQSIWHLDWISFWHTPVVQDKVIFSNAM